jgi:hypothetical protein
MKIEVLLLLIYCLELLVLQFVTIVSTTIQPSFLDWVAMYLIAIDNFTLVKAAVAVASIKVGLIFFIYALFFLFLIVLLIWELFKSKHLSFLAFFF